METNIMFWARFHPRWNKTKKIKNIVRDKKVAYLLIPNINYSLIQIEQQSSKLYHLQFSTTKIIVNNICFKYST